MHPMRSSRGRSRRRLLLVLLAALLPVATPAAGLPLSTLVGGGPVSGGETIVLEDFEATIAGDLLPVLSFYDVSLGGGGLVLTGPLSAADGEVGMLVLGFTARTTPGRSLTQVQLSGPVAAAGAGAQASADAVVEALGSGDLLATPGLFDAGAVPGGAVTLVTAPLPGAPEAVRVRLTVVLDSLLVGGAPGGSARVVSLASRFASVPEAGSFGLLGVGLVGLLWAGRPRRLQRAGSTRRERRRLSAPASS